MFLKKQAKKLIFAPKIALRVELSDPARNSFFPAGFLSARLQCSQLLWNCAKIKGSGYRKMRGVGNLYTDTIGYRTVVIDVCLLFNGPVVFSATYFRFLLVKLN